MKTISGSITAGLLAAAVIGTTPAVAYAESLGLDVSPLGLQTVGHYGHAMHPPSWTGWLAKRAQSPPHDAEESLADGRHAAVDRETAAGGEGGGR